MGLLDRVFGRSEKSAARGGDDELFDDEFQRKLDYLALVSRRVFAGRMRAERRTKKSGSGVEFADHREYQPGDDFRYLDWNLFGRLDKLFLKLYEEERELPVRIFLDASESMTFGEPRKFDFTPLPHWDLGPALGILDFERGTKLTGSRFYVLQKAGARLQRALIAWMLDLHIRQGYQEEYLPFMVKTAVVYGAGQLPKFADNLYKDHEEDYYFVPTAEVPLTGLHMDEILDEAALPKLYTAYTPCFRREKMSAGRDVRGIKRGHQFDKVEMYTYCKPEESEAQHEKMVKDAEETCALLGVPYRVKRLCTGDLGFGSSMTYDLELWAPGCDEWLEVSSISNVTDFQARRANIKYRPADGGKAKPLHTLNGSGLGLPRTLIAVMENYQQADGSIIVPEVLRPWMGGIEVIK